MLTRFKKESDRLDIMHKLVEVSLGGKFNLAPIPAQPQRILDIGTGTGIWAIEMGMNIRPLDEKQILRLQKTDDWFRRQIPKGGGRRSLATG